MRPSLEAAYRSSSDGEEDVTELDPLTHDGEAREGSWPAGGRLRQVSGNQKTDPKESTLNAKSSSRRAWFVPSRMCRWLILLFVGSCLLLLGVVLIADWKRKPKAALSPPWYPTPRGGSLKEWEESYKKAADLVRQMTLVEKVNITTGIGWMMGMCVGNTGPVPRLGFPSLCLQDGPLGIRFTEGITAFPAGITVGATWNKDLMYKRGRALGQEARLKGINVLLGPVMGPLGKTPTGGRNWESFGSDPVLQAVSSAATIRGIQEEGVIATAKHWIGNEQERFRVPWESGTKDSISSNIDDRTLHELYAWPFAESVRAGVGSVMCSYNRVNSSYACANSKLLNGLLKDELGFQGFVQSDWNAQRSGVASALAGLDVTMPGDGMGKSDGKSLWGAELTRAALNGSVPLERLNDMVTRVVAAYYQLGQDDETRFPKPPPDGDGGPNFSSFTSEPEGLVHPGSDDTTTAVVNQFKDVQGTGDDAHGLLAHQIAVEGTVLVKNDDDILPLSRTGNPEGTNRTNDGDSATPRKYRIGIFGEDARENQNGPNACADRACNTGTLASGWGSGAVDFPHLISPLQALMDGFDNATVDVAVSASNKLPLEPAAPGLEGLDDRDLCLVFANADAGEGYLEADGMRGDRNNLYLQKGGDQLIVEVAGRCPAVIVVVHAVGPVVVDNWIALPSVKAVVLAHLPGQESGAALADVLFGAVDASGRLPYTVGRQESDYGAGAALVERPGHDLRPQQAFTDGLYVDYRHFDRAAIEPRFAFGYGLSYTTFQLTSLLIRQRAPKTAVPAAPPSPPPATPPSYADLPLPAPADAVFPPGWRRLLRYVYPYLDSAGATAAAAAGAKRRSAAETGTKQAAVAMAGFPAGYETVRAPSAAGGGPGGNSALWDVVASVSATVTNTGARDGLAVVQLYVSFPAGVVDADDDDGSGGSGSGGSGSGGSSSKLVDFPVRVLRGFEKVAVAGGRQQRKQVDFELTRKDLSYWSERRQNWVMPTAGEFTISLGFSSRDIKLNGSL